MVTVVSNRIIRRQAHRTLSMSLKMPKIEAVLLRRERDRPVRPQRTIKPMETNARCRERHFHAKRAVRPCQGQANGPHQGQSRPKAGMENDRYSRNKQRSFACCRGARITAERALQSHIARSPGKDQTHSSSRATCISTPGIMKNRCAK